ncbi:MAG: UxaA family hydrolase [Anaerolineae bacterium]|nr:UxaA family hydrolase [Chloroflexota bacterium]
MSNTLLIHVDDSVGVALRDLPSGTPVALNAGTVVDVTTREPIPFGHKVALVPISQGQVIVKYGASIGIASRDIAPGEHVHVHNLKSVRGAAR